MTATFGFVQFEFTSEIGPIPGRYIVEPLDEEPEEDPAPAETASADDAPEEEEDVDVYEPVALGDELFGKRRGLASADVLVVRVLGVDTASGRRILARRPQRAEAETEPAPAPLCLATLIRATKPFDNNAAADRWLTGCLDDAGARDRVIAQGLHQLNLGVRAFRIGSGDPYMVEFTSEDPRVLRIGYGGAADVAEGRWKRAFVVPPGDRERVSRAERLRPAEVAASILAGNVAFLEGEELLLIAHRELQQDRPRSAALAARAALQLLRSEMGPRDGDPMSTAEQLVDVSKALETFAARALTTTPPEDDQAALWEVLRDAAGILDDWREQQLMDVR